MKLQCLIVKQQYPYHVSQMVTGAILAFEMHNHTPPIGRLYTLNGLCCFKMHTF